MLVVLSTVAGQIKAINKVNQTKNATKKLIGSTKRASGERIKK